MFGWLYDRVFNKLMDIVIERLNDEKLWKETINPLLDAAADRQIQRLQGRMGAITKAAMPKLDTNSLIAMFLQKFLMGGQNPLSQALNSSPDNVLTEV